MRGPPRTNFSASWKPHDWRPPPKCLRDATSHRLPHWLVPVWKEKYHTFRLMLRWRCLAYGIAQSKITRPLNRLNREAFIADTDKFYEELKALLPYAVCRNCAKRQGPVMGCICNGTGWLTKAEWENVRANRTRSRGSGGVASQAQQGDRPG